MNNRTHLEEITGIKSELSDKELAKELASKWKGRCGWSMCPAYDGFKDATNEDCCAINDGNESVEACTESLYKWLTSDYIKR